MVGRVAAGQACPDDSWSENTTSSSLRFRSNSSSQNDSEISVVSGWDTSSHTTLDLEEGFEENYMHRVRTGVAAQTCNTHDYSGDLESTECGVHCHVK